MLETELKCIIDKDVFNTIKARYKWDKIITQENHYYADTLGVLGKNRTTFRIRKSGENFKVQTKAHKNKSGALQVSEEAEFPVNDAPELILAKEAKKYTKLDTGDLFKLGYNKTVRHSLMWNDNTEICLDMTEYFDITDYEIEVEYTKDFPEELVLELKNYGVLFDKASVGKYTRFVKRLNEITNEG